MNRFWLFSIERIVRSQIRRWTQTSVNFTKFFSFTKLLHTCLETSSGWGKLYKWKKQRFSCPHSGNISKVNYGVSDSYKQQICHLIVLNFFFQLLDNAWRKTVKNSLAHNWLKYFLITSKGPKANSKKLYFWHVPQVSLRCNILPSKLRCSKTC